MKTIATLILVLAVTVLVSGCGGGGSGSTPLTPIVVNSTDDDANPPEGTTTLRSALARAWPNQAIEFDPALDGAVISLTIVGKEHSILRGEVMGIRDEPSGPVSYLVGYEERDYGRSALYAKRSVVIDASELPTGLTIAWAGAEPARVMAVYGNLKMTNVTVTGGSSEAVDISGREEVDWKWHDTKLWWPQCEALYATMLAYEYCREDWCLEWHTRIREYCLSHYPVKDHGEWTQKLDRQGNVLDEVIALPVKDPFHLPRVLIYLVESLGRLRNP